MLRDQVDEVRGAAAYALSEQQAAVAEGALLDAYKKAGRDRSAILFALCQIGGPNSWDCLVDGLTTAGIDIGARKAAVEAIARKGHEALDVLLAAYGGVSSPDDAIRDAVEQLDSVGALSKLRFWSVSGTPASRVAVRGLVNVLVKRAKEIPRDTLVALAKLPDSERSSDVIRSAQEGSYDSSWTETMTFRTDFSEIRAKAAAALADRGERGIDN
jgi:HEAT repeat protein